MFSNSYVKLAGVILVALVLMFGGYKVTHAVWKSGWVAALSAVKKQDDRAKAAAEQVEETANRCFDSGGSWNVASNSCDK